MYLWRTLNRAYLAAGLARLAKQPKKAAMPPEQKPRRPTALSSFDEKRHALEKPTL